MIPTKRNTQRNSGVIDYMPSQSKMGANPRNDGMVDVYQRVLEDKNHEIV